MRLSTLCLTLFRFLLPGVLIFTTGLYLYAPLLACSFPDAKRAQPGCSIPGQQRPAVPGEKAPFRLLAFGDPQLEGDTSLPDPNAPTFPNVGVAWDYAKVGDLKGVGYALRAVWIHDVSRLVYKYRKKLDLWGNDLYLAHIYRIVHWWSDPTHIVVLGDLLGSQWIGDEEFARRSKRFWERVFKGTERVPRAITGSSGRVEVLGQDERWKRRIIAVAGNHDIGYAGDIDERRVERFEETFGDVNWDIRFKLDNDSASSLGHAGFGSSPLTSNSPELHVVVLNTMNLDSPASNLELQQQSRDFAEAQLLAPENSNPNRATVLLTHIPLHKDVGVCTDGEFFGWFPNGGIKEQNHLIKGSSDYLLNGLTGDGTHGRAIVLNGHDHVGCDTYHYRHEEDGKKSWIAVHSENAEDLRADTSTKGIREITVRSMMGEFHGYSGFLSGWYDREAKEWKFEYSSCPFGIQHFWWAVHVFDLVVLGLGVCGLGLMIAEETVWADKPSGKVKKA